MQLVERGNTWAKLCQAEHQVHFAVANATVSLAHILAGPLPYPGPISLVTIQFPGMRSEDTTLPRARWQKLQKQPVIAACLFCLFDKRTNV